MSDMNGARRQLQIPDTSSNPPPTYPTVLAAISAPTAYRAGFLVAPDSQSPSNALQMAQIGLAQICTGAKSCESQISFL